MIDVVSFKDGALGLLCMVFSMSPVENLSDYVLVSHSYKRTS